MPTTGGREDPGPRREQIDLTPFGFTPTESLAYATLLETGPTGGYALAKRINLARANAYQALNGLVSKGAAMVTDGRPQRFKPVRPDALFAMLVEGQHRKLDLLERQIRGNAERTDETFVHLSASRAIYDLVMRTAAREEGPVVCAATQPVIAGTAPGWRRRRVVERPTRLLCIGSSDAAPPVEVDGTIEPSQWAACMPGAVLLMTAGSVAIGADNREGLIAGFWTTDQLLVGLTATVLAGTDP